MGTRFQVSSETLWNAFWNAFGTRSERKWNAFGTRAGRVPNANGTRTQCRVFSEQYCTSNENDGATTQQKVDGKFKSVVDSLTKRMWEAQHDCDVSKLDQFIGWLDRNREYWENVRDSNGRTIIHAAEENGNTTLVKTYFGWC